MNVSGVHACELESLYICEGVYMAVHVSLHIKLGVGGEARQCTNYSTLIRLE